MFGNNLDSIISSFTKTLANLDKLIENNQKKIKENTSLIEQFQEANQVRTVENTRAFSIKRKISELISI